MVKHLKKYAFVLVILLLFAGIFVSPTFAEDLKSTDVTETALLGNVKDDGSACGVFTILNLIVDIFSIGVGVLGAIGITIVGINYLTAGGDEEKTRKAKYRMLEIVVGLFAYAMLYAGAQFLLPGGKFDFGKRCETISDQELSDIKTRERLEKEKEAGEVKEKESKSGSGISQKTIPEEKSKAYEKCMKNAAPVLRNKVCKINNPVERISKTAKLLAGLSGSPKTIYKQAMKQSNSNVDDRGNEGIPPEGCQYIGKSCNTFVVTVLRASGVDLGVPSASSNKGNPTWVLESYFHNHPSKWKLVGHNPKKSKDGDIVVEGGNHITITVKNSAGKLVTAHASLCGFYPNLSSEIYTGYNYPSVFRYIGN